MANLRNISVITLVCAFGLSACGGSNSAGSFGGSAGGNRAQGADSQSSQAPTRTNATEERETVWDLSNTGEQGTRVQVNKYLWQASLDSLSFLPLEAADPFTGIMVFGYGRAPGSSRTYRATVHIFGPLLDATVLKVAVQTRGGAASAETQRQIENAILSRARQLRIARAL